MLDTGLSELGLHFGLEKTTQLTKLLADPSITDEMDINYHLKEYSKSLSYVVSKLRYEHLHLLLLCICSLNINNQSNNNDNDDSNNDTIDHLFVNTNLYPIKLKPKIIIIILKGFISYIEENSTESSTELKKKSTLKSKPLIKKLNNSNDIPSIDEEILTSSPSPTIVVKNVSLELLNTLLKFYQLFVLLPDSIHLLIYSSYHDIISLKELCINIIINVNYSEQVFEEILSILQNHCFNKFSCSFPTKDILNLSINSLLNKIEMESKFVILKQDWIITYHKIEKLFYDDNFQEKREFWLNYTQSLINFDTTGLIKKQLNEYYFIWINKYEAIQSLYYDILLKEELNEIVQYSQNQLHLYHKTHIFLFSPLVLEIIEKNIQIKSTNSLENNVRKLILPISLESFSTTSSLNTLFDYILNNLLQEENNESNENNENKYKNIVNFGIHILRIWGWGSEVQNENEKLDNLFQYWNDVNHNFEDIQREDDNEDRLMLNHQNANDNQIQLISLIKLLNICSKHNFWQHFIEILLLDIFIPKYKSQQISTKVLELANLNFAKDIIAWVSNYFVNIL